MSDLVDRLRDLGRDPDPNGAVDPNVVRRQARRRGTLKAAAAALVAAAIVAATATARGGEQDAEHQQGQQASGPHVAPPQPHRDCSPTYDGARAG